MEILDTNIKEIQNTAQKILKLKYVDQKKYYESLNEFYDNIIELCDELEEEGDFSNEDFNKIMELGLEKELYNNNNSFLKLIIMSETTIGEVIREKLINGERFIKGELMKF